MTSMEANGRNGGMSAEFDRSMELRDRGEFQHALELLRSLVAKLTLQDKKLLTHSYLQLGNIHGKLGEDGKAIESFRNAVELSPAHELSSLALFHCLFNAGQWTLAVGEAIRYLELHDSQDYRDILSSGFYSDVPPEVSALADRARELLRRYEPM